MTKQETAKQIVTQLIKALQNKNYIKRLTFSKYGLTQYEPDVLDEDLEQLLDIAQDSIEEYDKQANQKDRKHYFDITQEQKERIFERDLADRRNAENMTARQRRFVDAILGD